MIQVTLRILRTERGSGHSYLQDIPYSSENDNATVATALTDLNANPDTVDCDGNPVGQIEWECSCLQKKCGACAMRIDEQPGLACDTKLKDCTGNPILLEPLKKFPVVADLMVDRTIMQENLKTVGVWLRDVADLKEKHWELAYDGSRCLQCGCCLEVCPNFYPGGAFAGTAGFVPTARLLAELTETEKRQVRKAYRKHLYNGCGMSLACRNICPAGIDIDQLLVNSNAIAIWRRR